VAKKRKGIKRLKNSAPVDTTKSKLDQRAFGGNVKGPRFGFSVIKDTKYHHAVFRAKFAAHKFLMLLIEGDEYHWVDSNQLVTESGLCITDEHLKEIHDYELKSNKVKRWRLPDKYYTEATWFRSNTPHKPIPMKSSRKKISRKGMILIGDVCKEIGIHPRDARGILRALDIEKPKHGWAWRTKEEAEEIKKTIQQCRRK